MTERAVTQLHELASVSDGAIEVVGSWETKAGLVVDVSLDTRGIETKGQGIKVRNRERFQFVIDDAYPYRPPWVWVSHARWAGTPHVQWKRHLCLYAAPSVEWNPAEGMRGLIERLMSWLRAAAEATLDPDGQPLHPPVTYSSADAGQIVVNPDVGELVPWGETVVPGPTRLVYAWCEHAGQRIDILEWLTLEEAYDRVLADDFEPRDAAGRPFYVAPLILVSDELSMEYPNRASALAESLEEFGVPRDELLRAITSAGRFNGAIAELASLEQTAPVAVLLGTPARRVSGTRRLAHITAWRIDDFGEEVTGLLRRVGRLDDDELKEQVRSLAHDWLGFADIKWMVVHENRAELTNRRDQGSAASWLHGKRVLVLGCGALGAPIAEHCVRAGVRALTVADNSTVKPGILLRQPYSDADIGFNKARQLARRLTTLRRDLTVEAFTSNVITLFTGEGQTSPDYDLVIDATADIGVRAAVETARARQRDQWPPLITGLFGHDAVRALGILSRPGATGAGHDVLRRIAADGRGAAAGSWRDIVDDFFPDPPRTEMFFPEPGCSAPTFTGSAIQTTALASALFWATISELASERRKDPMVAVAVRLPGAETGVGTSRFYWPNDHVTTDVSGRYEIRLSTRALAEMRAETRRGARARGQEVETGGMLLGSFDEATGNLYVDAAVGPSPDSALSAVYFDHGTAGTQELIEHHRARTANRVGFVGMWHTHPYGRAQPSPTDEAGMGWIVSPSGTGRRALMCILGGPPLRWNAWYEDGELPDVYLRVVDRLTETERRVDGRPQVIPDAAYYPGGYFQPPSESPHSLSWWQQALRRRR
ncbi:ThiF family adenylyltransferase [Nocardioides rotundus]|uniref:ThiF family adenylyltransferase n=1 Tax=Nocardioides rotundus TaxID=1774216 RepID=UPI001CBBA69E|nr:ThiF family adenylyltransferase [Nocardioides rotundus]UAL30447.1 ThiF family adenylyltransferase [Nocardioides rotundus]